jgi:hypothetical protein
MTRRIVAALAFEAIVLAMCLAVTLDLSAHRRVEKLGGVNIWNYRGPVAHERQPREIRLAFVGGTRAFSWGVAASETISSSVGWTVRLATDRPGEPLRPVVSIDLGRLGALADSYAPTIERFAYLAPDYICLYDDLGVPGATTADRASAIYDWTGYMPALPLVLREKGLLMSQSGSGLHRVAGAVLTTIGVSAGAIDRALARSPAARTSNGPHAYADAMIAAIDAAHRHARGVVLVLAPMETAIQKVNWLSLVFRLAERRDTREWLRLVDLSEVTELYDDGLRLDGWNFGVGGIAIAAAPIGEAVLDLVNHAR